MLAGIIIWTNNLIKMTEFYTNILDIQPNNILDNHVSFHFGKLKFIIEHCSENCVMLVNYVKKN